MSIVCSPHLRRWPATLVLAGALAWPVLTRAASPAADCAAAQKTLDAGRRTQKHFTQRIIEPVIGGRCVADGDAAFTNASSFASCDTAPKYVMDGDASTRWCEGRPRSGRREVVLVPMDAADWDNRVHVLTVPDGVEATRPSLLRMHVFSASRSGPAAEPCHVEWSSLKPLFTHEIQLEDSGEYQQVDVPTLPGGEEGIVVGFEIRETFGDGDQTCISELGPGLSFNAWLAAQLNLLFPGHRMTSAELTRFVEGTRIVASHVGFETEGQVWRFVLVSWLVGVEFVRLPWAKAIFADATLSPEAKADLMMAAVKEHEDSMKEKER